MIIIVITIGRFALQNKLMPDQTDFIKKELT